MLTEQVNVGIVLDSIQTPNWIGRIIRYIENCESLNLSVVIINAPRGYEKEPLFNSKLAEFVFNLYCKFDNKLFRTRVSEDALQCCQSTEVEKLLNSKKVLKFEYWDEEELEKIEKNIDVWLWLSSKPINGYLFALTKFGVWSTDMGNIRTRLIFWALVNRLFTRDIQLKIQLSNPDKIDYVFTTTTSTFQHSFFLNLNAEFWKVANLYIKILGLLPQLKIMQFRQLAILSSMDTSSVPCVRLVDSLKLLGRVFHRNLKNRFFFHFYREEWFIAVRKKETSILLAPYVSSFQIVPQPQNHFYADPFLFEFDKRVFLFIEDYLFDKEKGVISVSEIDKAGNLSEPSMILEKDYHLSYPFVFKSGKDIFMIPESSANRTIELYRSVDFPLKWALEKVLVNNIIAVDNTLLKYHGKFWLFSNVATDQEEVNNELHLFYAESLWDDWQPHPLNPIVSNIKSSRSAGRIFIENGNLYRPSQNSAERYGHSIIINRISKLSETDYAEEMISEIPPTWLENAECTHTYNFIDEFEVTDGKRFIKKWRVR